MDDIAKAFQEISVDDFLRETSAIRIKTYGPEQRHLTHGKNNFDGFTDTLIESCVKAVEENEFSAFSILHNRQEQRFFYPDDDETAYHYASRLRREAEQMSATWLFTAMLAPGRTYEDGDDVDDINADDQEQVRAALETGALQLGVCWFAAFREDGESLHRGGMIMLGDDGVDDQVEGGISPDHNPFHYVLGDE